MKKAFVCLGNQGGKYENTRHNVGRLFCTSVLGGVRGKGLKEGLVYTLNDNQFLFLNCYMNESGEFLKPLLKRIGCFDYSSLVVIHDDLDIPFGEYKIQFGRGEAGHRGVESLFNSLGTKEFWRIRIGIGRPPSGIEPEKFVLMPFNKEEKERLEEVFEKVRDDLENEKTFKK